MPRYLVVVVDRKQLHTADGVLSPVLADGFYDDIDRAEDVAEYLADEQPTRDTFIVEILRQMPRMASNQEP